MLYIYKHLITRALARVPITLKPEQGIPLPTSDTSGFEDLLRSSITYEAQFKRVDAAVNALNKLIEMGATISEDGVVEGEIDLNEEGASRRAVEAFSGTKNLSPSEYKPAVLLKLRMMLKDYEKNVVESADQLRIYVTNRLLEESSLAASGKPSDRIKALELIGKMQEVGLFSERTETVIKHGTTEELEAVLRNRLRRLIELEKDDYTVVTGQISE